MSEQPGSQLVDIEIEYVGFWRRVVAALIDAVLLTFLIAPFMIWTYGLEYYTDLDREFKLIESPGELIANWIVPAVLTILLWRYWQTTPGKYLFTAYVVDARTLQRATLGQYTLRYIGYFLSMVPCFFGVLWVAFDRRKQGWHDKVARTIVVRRATATVPPAV